MQINSFVQVPNCDTNADWLIRDRNVLLRPFRFALYLQKVPTLKLNVNKTCHRITRFASNLVVSW